MGTVQTDQTITLMGTDYPDVLIAGGTYENGVAAVQLFTDDGELLTTVSVNLPDLKPSGRCVWVKTWSENEGLLEEMTEAGWGEPTGRTAPAGFATAIEFEFDTEIWSQL